jgi:hypothetical protein
MHVALSNYFQRVYFKSINKISHKNKGPLQTWPQYANKMTNLFSVACNKIFFFTISAFPFPKRFYARFISFSIAPHVTLNTLAPTI